MRIEILPEAREDLIAGFRFYENQASGLGGYCRDSLLADVDRLAANAGVHAKVFGYHRSLSKRFETRSLPALPRCYPRSFTFHVGPSHALHSIRNLLRRGS